MAVFVSTLLLLAIQYGILDCTKRTLRYVYKPYGIEMCKALNQVSTTDSFHFYKEDLSCRRKSTKDYELFARVSPHKCQLEDIRRNLSAVCYFQTRLKVCNVCDEDTRGTQLVTLRMASVSPSAMSEFGELEFNRYRRHHCRKGMKVRFPSILHTRLEYINCRDRQKRTPVMVAAFDGQVKMFDYLVSNRCDLSAVNDVNENVLHFACRGGNADIVRKLIVNEKCDLESRDDNGRTPILVAARYGHREVFELLKENGCNLTAVDGDKNNILHLACRGGHVDMVQYIVSQNIVSIESRGMKGRTPVLTAVRYGHIGLFDFLKGRGCNMTAVDNDNNNILYLACMYATIDPVQYIGSQKIVSMNLSGPEESIQITPIRYSTKEVFSVLKGRGCNLRAVDTDRNNILHLACCHNNESLFKHLLQLRDITDMKKKKNKVGLSPVEFVKLGTLDKWIKYKSLVVLQC